MVQWHKTLLHNLKVGGPILTAQVMCLFYFSIFYQCIRPIDLSYHRQNYFEIILKCLQEGWHYSQGCTVLRCPSGNFDGKRFDLPFPWNRIFFSIFNTSLHKNIFEGISIFFWWRGVLGYGIQLVPMGPWIFCKLISPGKFTLPCVQVVSKAFAIKWWFEPPISANTAELGECLTIQTDLRRLYLCISIYCTWGISPFIDLGLRYAYIQKSGFVRS